LAAAEVEAVAKVVKVAAAAVVGLLAPEVGTQPLRSHNAVMPRVIIKSMVWWWCGGGVR
jgi:hypothetical protein